MFFGIILFGSFHTKWANICSRFMVTTSDFYEIFIIWSYHWSMKNLKISASKLQPFPRYGSLKFWAILPYAKFWKKLHYQDLINQNWFVFEKSLLDGCELLHPQFQMSNLKIAIGPLWIPKSGKIKNVDFCNFVSPQHSWQELVSDDCQHFSKTRVFDQKSELQYFPLEIKRPSN